MFFPPREEKINDVPGSIRMLNLNIDILAMVDVLGPNNLRIRNTDMNIRNKASLQTTKLVLG